jgi:hypothetical protein
MGCKLILLRTFVQTTLEGYAKATGLLPTIRFVSAS